MGQAGKSADLKHLAVDLERPGDGVQNILAGPLGVDQPLHRQSEGDGELVAAQAGNKSLVIATAGDRFGNSGAQRVTNFIAMAVADCFQAIDLERGKDDALACAAGLGTKQFHAVGETLAVKQAGQRVGRCGKSRALLRLLPFLCFVPKVDIAPPAEEDQRDVEDECGAGDLQTVAEMRVGEADLLEKGCTVPDEEADGAD